MSLSPSQFDVSSVNGVHFQIHNISCKFKFKILEAVMVFPFSVALTLRKAQSL